MRGGGRALPKFFGTFSKSAFSVDKRNLFLSKCQQFELETFETVFIRYVQDSSIGDLVTHSLIE